MRYGILFTDGKWLGRWEWAWNVDGAYMKVWKSKKYVGLFESLQAGQEWLDESGMDQSQMRVVSKVDRAVVRLRCLRETIESTERSLSRHEKDIDQFKQKLAPEIERLELLLQQNYR